MILVGSCGVEYDAEIKRYKHKIVQKLVLLRKTRSKTAKKLINRDVDKLTLKLDTMLKNK